MYPSDIKRAEFLLKHPWHSKPERIKKMWHEIEKAAQNQIELGLTDNSFHHLQTLSLDQVNYFFKFLFLHL